jgi:hypothetical protein
MTAKNVRSLMTALAIGALMLPIACTSGGYVIPPKDTTSGGGNNTTTASSSSSTGGSTTGTTTGGTTTGGSTGGYVDGGPDAGPPPVPSNIVFVGAANPFLGVDYKASYSINPINTFKFQVISDSDAGCPDASVSFAGGATNALGSSLLVPPGALVSADGGFTVFTDLNGNTTAQVQAGYKVGQVVVLATTVLPNGQTRSASATSYVVGTQPSVPNSGIACGTSTAQTTSLVNIPVYSGSNNPVCAVKSNYAGTTICQVKLGDRFGNAIGVSTAVNFYSEAGLWQSQTVNTPAFGDTTNPPGIAVNTLKTDQSALPQDVDPNPDEPSQTGMCLGTTRTFNPRDGLVTVMAAFTGEEEYKDLFGLNYWVPGDPFYDLPQPFVDNDDSSIWKPGDACAGTSTDGGCDGPNHMWDGNGNVWVQNRILYTGDPVNTVWNPSPGPTLYGMPVEGTVTWSDVNINLPSSLTVCNVYAPTSGEPSGFTCTYPVGGNVANPTDGLGMYAQQIPVCDAGLIVIDGGTQMNPICSYLTVVTGYNQGFSGTYQLSASAGNDAGPEYCIYSSAKITGDGTDSSQLCGTFYGFGLGP